MPSVTARPPVKGLPKTLCVDPWYLVEHNGETRLAYMVKLYGGGCVAGPALGGRGHLMSDDGVKFDPSTTEFHQSRMLYFWRKRPSTSQLEKARAKEAA